MLTSNLSEFKVSLRMFMVIRALKISIQRPPGGPWRVFTVFLVTPSTSGPQLKDRPTAIHHRHKTPPPARTSRSLHLSSPRVGWSSTASCAMRRAPGTAPSGLGVGPCQVSCYPFQYFFLVSLISRFPPCMNADLFLSACRPVHYYLCCFPHSRIYECWSFFFFLAPVV